MTSPYAGKNLGAGVPEGFTLPWNTTRTLADCWGLVAKKYDGVTRNDGTPKRQAGGRPKLERPAPGKAKFAGHDKSEVQFRSR